MNKSNPTRPDAPEEEKALRDHDDLPDTDGPPLRDQPGDRDARGRSFADDVRSDTGVENGEPK
ncbi:MAG: hypothetical protein ACTIJY_07235 [Luteimonas sp.]